MFIIPSLAFYSLKFVKCLIPEFGPFKDNTSLPGMCSTFKHTQRHKICPCFDTGALVATLFCKKVENVATAIKNDDTLFCR